MKEYTLNEIKGKHGQCIAYYSNQPGETDLERYMNSETALASKTKKHIVSDHSGNDITCIVDKKRGPNGHILVCFNALGEIILNVDDCFSNDVESIKESLSDWEVL